MSTQANVLSGGDPSIHGVVGIGANIPLPFVETLAPGKPWEPGPRGHISECALRGRRPSLLGVIPLVSPFESFVSQSLEVSPPRCRSALSSGLRSERALLSRRVLLEEWTLFL